MTTLKNFNHTLGITASALLLIASSAFAAPSDDITKDISCNIDETLYVKTVGLEDNFQSGIEITNPRPAVMATSIVTDYLNHHSLSDSRHYDQGTANNFFVESIRLRNLELSNRTVQSGVIMVGMQNPGGNDSLFFGNLAKMGTAPNNTLGKIYAGRISNLVSSGWTKSGTVYYSDLSNLPYTKTGSNKTMLDWVKKRRFFDILIQDDTHVDFVKIALCVS